MCIAIFQKPGAKARMDELDEAARCNPHGAGYSFRLFDRASGQYKIKTVKNLEWKAIRAQYIKDWKRHGARSPFLVHFRIASNGPVIEENCHPFPLADGGALIHNGIMPFECSKDENDTRKFVAMLDMLPEGWADNTELVQILEKGLGGNKVAMLWPDGRGLILNERVGHWKDDIWYSNRSYVIPTHTQTPTGNNAWRQPTYARWVEHTDGQFYPLHPVGNQPKAPNGVYPKASSMGYSQRMMEDDALDFGDRVMPVNNRLPVVHNPNGFQRPKDVPIERVVVVPDVKQPNVNLTPTQQASLRIADSIIDSAAQALEEAKAQGRVDSMGFCPVCGEDLHTAYARLHHDKETCELLARHPLQQQSDLVSLSEKVAARARLRELRESAARDEERANIVRYPGGRTIVQYPDV